MLFIDFNYHTYYKWRYEPIFQSGYFQCGSLHDRCWPLMTDLTTMLATCTGIYHIAADKYWLSRNLIG